MLSDSEKAHPIRFVRVYTYELTLVKKAIGEVNSRMRTIRRHRAVLASHGLTTSHAINEEVVSLIEASNLLSHRRKVIENQLELLSTFMTSERLESSHSTECYAMFDEGSGLVKYYGIPTPKHI